MTLLSCSSIVNDFLNDFIQQIADARGLFVNHFNHAQHTPLIFRSLPNNHKQKIVGTVNAKPIPSLNLKLAIIVH
jgi:hypothetical protein